MTEPLPLGVDVAQLAGLVAELVAGGSRGQIDVKAIADQVAAQVAAQLLPAVHRLEAAALRCEAEAARSRRGIGPYVPPPTSTPN